MAKIPTDGKPSRHASPARRPKNAGSSKTSRKREAAKKGGSNKNAAHEAESPTLGEGSGDVYDAGPSRAGGGGPPDPAIAEIKNTTPGPTTIALNTALDQKFWLFLAIGRVALRGPLPGIAPMLAAGLTDGASVSSAKNRAGIAVGAMSAVESMITGDHQITWLLDTQTDPIHNALSMIGRRKMETSNKRGKQPKRTAEQETAAAIQGLEDENVSAAINKTLKILEELSRFATSAVSYWNVVGGTGNVSVGSSAALMGASLGCSLFVTVYLYKQVTDTESRRDLRSVATHNPLDNPDYLAARKDVASTANRWGYILAYAITGSLGVAGVLTGLIAAKEAMDAPAWQQAKFYPVLWASYNLMKAQVDMMRSLKSAPAPFVLVQADAARDSHFGDVAHAEQRVRQPEGELASGTIIPLDIEEV